ncbi:DNA-binding protein [Parahaliea aestuarii]|uniref:DNA-binding protein n=1 Tax=Parahaliea aestuarii TaxID=1852021 RepID=UPI0016500A86|nr:DNA-binding protein [Parahaliea aestuarii]
MDKPAAKESGTTWNTPATEAARIGVTTRTLARWRRSRVGPPWFQVCGGIRYRPDITDAYLLETRQDPVAEAAE